MTHKLQHNKVEKHGQFLCANLVGFPWPGHIYLSIRRPMKQPRNSKSIRKLQKMVCKMNYNFCNYNLIEKARKRCFKCSGCTAEECGICKHCLDKPKYGGPGIRKQCCVKRKCIMIHKSNNTKVDLAMVCMLCN